MTKTKTAIVLFYLAAFEFRLDYSYILPLFLGIERFYEEHYEVCSYLSLNSSYILKYLDTSFRILLT